MLSLNMALFFMFGPLIDPYSGVYRVIYFSKKLKIHKNVFIHIVLYIILLQILYLNMALPFMFGLPLDPYSEVYRGITLILIYPAVKPVIKSLYLTIK